MSVKEVLANMNFARWIIVVGGVGSLALCASGWSLYSKRAGLEASLAPDGRVERSVRSIQGLGKQYSKLKKDLGGENLRGQDDMATYLATRAVDARVALGSVISTPQNPPFEVQKGVFDYKYGIKPQPQSASTDKGQPRDRIVNYFYKLESDSRRVRVTFIHMWQDQKLKEWEVGNDQWKWEAAVTTRERDESKAAK